MSGGGDNGGPKSKDRPKKGDERGGGVVGGKRGIGACIGGMEGYIPQKGTLWGKNRKYERGMGGSMGGMGDASPKPSGGYAPVNI